MQKRIAIPVHNGRVSPVFDAAQRVVLIDTNGGAEVGRSEQEIGMAFPPHRAKWLAEQGVGLLICGAISLPLAQMVQSHGIQLLPWIVGELDDVVDAYLNGGLQGPQFAMPGCCGRRHRHGRRWQP